MNDPPKKTYDSLEAAVSLPDCVVKSLVMLVLHLDAPRSTSWLKRNGSSGRTVGGNAVSPACCVGIRAGHLAAQDRSAL